MSGAPLSAAQAARGQRRLSELRAHDGEPYFLSQPAAAKGARALLRGAAGSAVAPGETALSVRSRVHEYGGGSYLVCAAGIFAVEAQGQQLQRLEGGRWRALTCAPDWRFAAPCWHPPSDSLICVGEYRGGAAVENALLRVALADGAIETLVSGDDFYAAPVLSGDGARLAWVSWSHPHMPWQQTRLWWAPLAADGRCGRPRSIGGGAAQAIQQPAWLDDGRLAYISDRDSGWWNLWCADLDSGASHCAAPITAELGRAPWELGLSTWCWRGDSVAAIAAKGGRDQLLLGRVDGDSWRVAPLGDQWQRLSGIAAAAQGWWLLGAGPARETQLLHCTAEGAVRAVGEAPSLALAVDRVSRPESIRCPCDGREVQAFFYRPVPAVVRPPLVVVMHGGPTSATDPCFRPLVQFWTSRGLAVVDVNYRGSTGFGRHYRLALARSWGQGEVRDCVAVVEWLIARGEVDPRRVAIRGGSAGGLTALAAAIASARFCAVGCHYGVCDLRLLAAHTHKFESRYLDHLVGPLPAAQARYRARSPLSRLTELRAAVYVSHGRLDRVVPVAQAEALVAALRAQGNTVEVDYFDNERHGYHDDVNIARQLNRELALFERAFARA